MKSRVHLIQMAWCAMLLIFIACGTREIHTLTVINEMQACEDENVFYRIIDPDGNDVNDKVSRDSLVLFVFADSLKRCYDLFYPSFPDRRYQFTIRGYYLDGKVGVNSSYGCPGSRRFQLVEILRRMDVTETASYPINNQ